MVTSTRPNLAAVEVLLRDGYWDRTEIIRMADGSQRVRKQSKGQHSAGPWGMDNLRAEAQYLQDLEPHLLDLFPRLIASWEEPAPGYDMAYKNDYVDVGQLARAKVFNQQQANQFQTHLGKRVFGQLHTPSSAPCELSDNILDTLQKAAHAVASLADFSCLLEDPLNINGQACAPFAVNIMRLTTQTQLLQAIDSQPQVRLHGDLFLENILLPKFSSLKQWPTQLVLIDPVSVAGISSGHPLFDLAKYESYSTGELPAMRRGHTQITGMHRDFAQQQLGFTIDWHHKDMKGFTEINWHSSLRQSYVNHYGPVDEAMYALLEAYFASAMVICTDGVERQARALKALVSLERAILLSV
jgi:hypothetical protein|tara:strand:+ start:4284 stop:5351 length:1068 start_codon:yes stop_codon:yes gene_type:complete